jgi:hypothetical protein
VRFLSLDRIADEKCLYLTTTGRMTGKLHTVELWFAVAGTNIYLSHEGEFTDWMKNLLKDNRVVVEIQGKKWNGTAQIFQRGEAFGLGKHALYLKYYGPAQKAIIDDWFSASAVIEIRV